MFSACQPIRVSLLLGNTIQPIIQRNVYPNIRFQEYLDFCKVPRDLRNRIRDYYEMKYQGKMFDEGAILQELNPLMREKVLFSSTFGLKNKQI